MRPDNWRELKQNEVVDFNVHCKMNKAWANEFLSMLKHMEEMGNVGCSGFVAFYADGDGDFKPKFEINYEFENKEIQKIKNPEEQKDWLITDEQNFIDHLEGHGYWDAC